MYYFIVNPKAQSGRGAVVWKRIRRVMKEKGLPFEGAVLASVSSMITSGINVVIAVVLSNLIALPVIRALRRAKLLDKMER